MASIGLRWVPYQEVIAWYLRLAGGGGMPKDVWAFDFDGVVCDSVGESSLSAWKAALKKWPEIFGTPEAESKRDSVLDGMRIVRPVVETGCVAAAAAATAAPPPPPPPARCRPMS